jgi:hypothetical protein
MRTSKTVFTTLNAFVEKVRKKIYKVALRYLGPKQPLPPTTLLAQLNARCKSLLDEARKEVYKVALKRIPSEIRHSPLGDRIIAFNVGSYLLTPASLNELYDVIKDHDDAYRRSVGAEPLSYDEGWDVAGHVVFTFMHGFLDKHNLTPEIPAGSFIPLVDRW